MPLSSTINSQFKSPLSATDGARHFLRQRSHIQKTVNSLVASQFRLKHPHESKKTPLPRSFQALLLAAYLGDLENIPFDKLVVALYRHPELMEGLENWKIDPNITDSLNQYLTTLNPKNSLDWKRYRAIESLCRKLGKHQKKDSENFWSTAFEKAKSKDLKTLLLNKSLLPFPDALNLNEDWLREISLHDQLKPLFLLAKEIVFCEDVPNLASVITLPNLKRLTLRKITDPKVVQFMQRTPILHELVLNSCVVRSDDVIKLPQLPHLKKVALISSQISNRCLGMLFSKLPNIKSFSLSVYTEADLGPSCELPSLPSLQNATFAFTQITDANLMRFLRKTPHLQSLDVNFSSLLTLQIKDNLPLPWLPDLEHLEISGTQVNEEDLLFFLQYTPELTQLSYKPLEQMSKRLKDFLDQRGIEIITREIKTCWEGINSK